MYQPEISLSGGLTIQASKIWRVGVDQAEFPFRALPTFPAQRSGCFVVTRDVVAEILHQERSESVSNAPGSAWAEYEIPWNPQTSFRRTLNCFHNCQSAPLKRTETVETTTSFLFTGWF